MSILSLNPYYHVIFSVTEIDKINWAEVHEVSASELRKSLDGTKTFVKYEGTVPECVTLLSTGDGPYNYQDFITILRTSEWTDLKTAIDK
jgi:hypothetical protein